MSDDEKVLKQKLESVARTLESVFTEVTKHVLSGDPRIAKLPDLQLILGTVTVMHENKILGEQPATPEQAKEQHRVNKEEEFELADKDAKVTYH